MAEKNYINYTVDATGLHFFYKNKVYKSIRLQWPKS